jgi:hypothetical protein
MHIIEQFNGGIYDTIIASDEKLIEINEELANAESNKKTPSKKYENFNFKIFIFNFFLSFYNKFKFKK